MNRFHFILLACTVVILGLSCDVVIASTVTYTSKTDFQAAAGPLVLESFEELPVGDFTTPQNTPHFTITPDVPPPPYRQAAVCIDVPTHGYRAVRFGGLAPDADKDLTFFFDFSHPIRSFSIHIIDFGNDDGMNGDISFSNDIGDNLTIATNPPAHGRFNIIFFGVITQDAFSHVEISCTTILDGVAFDEAYFSAPLLGDANGDGLVDVVDLGILATHYGIGNDRDWEQGDFTGDGLVDVNDLGILATHYGESTPPGATVPEPCCIVLLVLGAVALLMSFRRK